MGAVFSHSYESSGLMIHSLFRYKPIVSVVEANDGLARSLADSPEPPKSVAPIRLDAANMIVLFMEPLHGMPPYGPCSLP